MMGFCWSFARLFLGFLGKTWEWFFHFSKFLIYWVLGQVFSRNEAKLWASLQTSKMVGFGWNSFFKILIIWAWEQVLKNWQEQVNQFSGKSDNLAKRLGWRKSPACPKVNLCYLILNIWSFTIGPSNNLKILKCSPMRCAHSTITRILFGFKDPLLTR